jgi:hypothetical protein
MVYQYFSALICFPDRNKPSRTRRLSSIIVSTQHLRARSIKAKPLKPVRNVLPRYQATRNLKSSRPRNPMKRARLGMYLEMDPKIMSPQLVVLLLPRFLPARNHEHSLFLTVSLVLHMLYHTRTCSGSSWPVDSTITSVKLLLHMLIFGIRWICTHTTHNLGSFWLERMLYFGVPLSIKNKCRSAVELCL